MDELMDKYRSRKWQLTVAIFFASCVFAGFQLLSSELASVFASLGISYNGFQGLIDWQKARQNNT